MKRSVLWAAATLLLVSGCGRGDYPGVRGVIERQVPWLADRVELRACPAGEAETFTLRTEEDKLVVEATTANAAARGIGWYLKYCCGRSMSHRGDNLAPAAPLPLPGQPISCSTRSKYRYALNYCTYNYTMSFYTWEDWERELDWMALNGVNLMLVANGSEAVWQRTLRRLGYTEEEIAKFICGPAYNAWWLMGNVEGWGGPMPQSQIDSRVATVRKMLARMRELGIEPLMPGFYGMVPSDYAKRTDDHVIEQGKWWVFDRPAILDPTTPEFARVAAIFYEETRKLYGDDIRFFSGDPFHEGGSTEGVDLGAAGRAIQQAMQKHFPGSVWVLQGWQANPKPELLECLDRRYALVQELYGEKTANWERRQGYEGTPFIWATVTNFGERTGVNGRLQRFADEVYRAETGEYASWMQGVGILPEGIDNNPVAYDLVLELPWHDGHVEVSEWIEDYIAARYGRRDERVSAAWQIFLETVYASNMGFQGAPENVLCARPDYKLRSVSTWGRLAKCYDTERFAEGVRLLASARADFADSDTYRIDLVDMLRQTIANRADGVFADLMAAYDRRDRAAFDRQAGAFLSLHDLADELLAHHPAFRVDTWQRRAVSSGQTPEEQANNLYNAMVLVTYWGGDDPAEESLNDYSYREWAGMMSLYYKQRWALWFDYLSAQLEGRAAERPDFFSWEHEWVENHCEPIEVHPETSFDEIVGRIL